MRVIGFLVQVFGMALVATQAHARVAIELEETVRGSGAVTLRDLGHVKDGSSDSSRVFETIEVARGSCSQPMTRLTRDQIERRLHAEAAKLRGQIEWSGSQEVVVHWDCQTIVSDRFVEVAAAWLTGQSGTVWPEWNFTALNRMRNLAVPSGEISLVVDATGLARPNSRIAVPVVVRVGDKERARVPVWFSGRRTGDSRAVANRLPAERAATVARNQRVAFRLSQGAVALESTGVALADGEIGESLLVRLAAGRKVLKGRVTGPGVVENEE